MKKLITIALLGVIVGSAPGVCRAYAPDNFSGGSFMRIDYRDSMNRRISGPAAGFEETTFTRFYAVFSPIGVTRWQSSRSDLGIFNNARLNIPYAAASLGVNERQALPRINVSNVYSSFGFPGITFLLSLTALLSFESRLQTKLEPRFQPPVYLE